VIDADLVAIVEDGRVVEVGSPDDLIARGGRFATLYDRWLAAARNTSGAEECECSSKKLYIGFTYTASPARRSGA
jgi:hypothetical protein